MPRQRHIIIAFLAWARPVFDAVHGIPGFLEDSATWAEWGREMNSDLMLNGVLVLAGVGAITYDWWKPRLITKFREMERPLRGLPRQGIRFGRKKQEKILPDESRVRKLTNEEINLVEGVDLEVQFNHDHSDFWGIVEDVFEGKRLSDSPCTECGKPRNQYIL